jgi:hypothetical protein
MLKLLWSAERLTAPSLALPIGYDEALHLRSFGVVLLCLVDRFITRGITEVNVSVGVFACRTELVIPIRERHVDDGKL